MFCIPRNRDELSYLRWLDKDMPDDYRVFDDQVRAAANVFVRAGMLRSTVCSEGLVLRGKLKKAFSLPCGMGDNLLELLASYEEGRRLHNILFSTYLSQYLDTIDRVQGVSHQQVLDKIVPRKRVAGYQLDLFDSDNETQGEHHV